MNYKKYFYSTLILLTSARIVASEVADDRDARFEGPTIFAQIKPASVEALDVLNALPAANRLLVTREMENDANFLTILARQVDLKKVKILAPAPVIAQMQANLDQQWQKLVKAKPQYARFVQALNK